MHEGRKDLKKTFENQNVKKKTINERKKIQNCLKKIEAANYGNQRIKKDKFRRKHQNRRQ